MIDAKQLAEMLIDGRAKLLHDGMTNFAGGKSLIVYTEPPPKPQTVGEKIEAAMGDTFQQSARCIAQTRYGRVSGRRSDTANR